MKIWLLVLFVPATVFSATLASDGSQSDVAAKISAASDGDTITLPAGIFTWTTGVTISKAIKLQGVGSSGFQGYSTTSVALGTGSKTFTTQGGLSFPNGMAVTAMATGNAGSNMVGTVTSYSGTTLILNITSANGSGTVPIWTFITNGASETVILANTTSAATWTINETAAGYIEFTGIHDTEGTANLNRMVINGGGKPVIIHDCRFSSGANRSRSILTACNQGLIYRCSFDNGFYLGNGDGHGNDVQGIALQNATDTGDWSRGATLGNSDNNGTNNFYVEDCYFAAIYLQSLDVSLNARAVIRHCTFDQAGMTGHGNDTGPYGARHCEIYNNVFHFTDIGILTTPLDYQVFVRGGTYQVFSNTFENPSSSQWGAKSTAKLTVEGVDRSDTANSLPLINCPTTYMVAHQVGQGFESGSLISDPCYFWSNSFNNVTVYDGAGTYNNNCASPPAMSTFIQVNRDYFMSARPNYTPYTYPHPLQGQNPVAPSYIATIGTAVIGKGNSQ